jgi:hypothetical protein
MKSEVFLSNSNALAAAFGGSEIREAAHLLLAWQSKTIRHFASVTDRRPVGTAASQRTSLMFKLFGVSGSESVL